MNYKWLFVALLMTLPFSYGEESKVQNKTITKLNTKSPSDRLQTKKKLGGSWMEHVRRQWEEEGPDPDRGPVRSEHYNPNYGYEPYWPGGKWVFTPISTTRKQTIVTAATQKYRYRPPNRDKNCGLKCGIVYQTYGEICGRNKMLQYKTFSSYCALKSEDCDELEDWRAVYSGRCKTIKLLWPTSIVFGPKTFINKFKREYRNTFRFVATNVGFPQPITAGRGK